MTVYLVYTFSEPDVLARTIVRLSPSQFIIHVDRKVDEGRFRDAVPEAALSRVTFVGKRWLVNWGGYSQVRAIRSLVTYAIDSGDDPDEYLVLLSGQDYPLRSSAEIDRHLSSSGRQFIRYFRISESEYKYKRQIRSVHFRDLPLLRRWSIRYPIAKKTRNGIIVALERLFSSRLGPRLNPPAEIMFGPTHFAITRSYARRLEEASNRSFDAYFKRVFVPEEKFYQTLAGVIERESSSDGLRDGSEPYVGSGNWRYANIHHIHPSLVKVYGASDWEEVRSSRALFLRKVSMAKSALLLDLIDKAADSPS